MRGGGSESVAYRICLLLTGEGEEQQKSFFLISVSSTTWSCLLRLDEMRQSSRRGYARKRSKRV